MKRSNNDLRLIGAEILILGVVFNIHWFYIVWGLLAIGFIYFIINRKSQ